MPTPEYSYYKAAYENLSEKNSRLIKILNLKEKIEFPEDVETLRSKIYLIKNWEDIEIAYLYKVYSQTINSSNWLTVTAKSIIAFETYLSNTGIA